MPQQVRVRRHTIVNFQADAPVQEDLLRGMVVREFMLRIRGTIDVGADGGSVAGVGAHRLVYGPADAWSLIKRLQIIANGSDVLRNMTGEELFWLNKFWYGTSPPINPVFFNVEADDVQAFEFSLILPFWMPSSVRPIDTALDTRTLSDLRIEVTWGDFDDFVNGGVGGGFTVDPQLEVYALESFGVTGQFASTKITRIQRTQVAIQNQFQIKLPVTSVYRAFLINTKGAIVGAENANAPDAPDLLDNIKLLSGTTVFQDIEAKLLQQWTRLRKGHQELMTAPRYDANVVPDEPVTEAMAVSSKTDRDAWYYLDLVTDGRLTEGIDTVGFSEFVLELDVNTLVDFLNVLPIEIIPVRGAQGQASIAGAGRTGMKPNQARRLRTSNRQ